MPAAQPPLAAMNDPAAWRCAVPDWADRLARGETPMPALPALDRRRAEQAVTILNRLRIPDLPGKPTFGEIGGEWLRDILRAIAGSLDTTGIRRIRQVFALTPKKNGKTTGGAAIMLTLTMLNQRPDALFGLFGPTQKITEIAYDAVAGMIAADDGLRRLFHVRDHLKQVTYRPTGATLSITTFDPSVATGGKYAGWMLDEVHLLGSVAHASRTVGQLRGARTSITEQFGLMITTQSDKPPTGLFREELDYARGVRDGRIDDPGYLAVTFEFPESIQTAEGEPWADPALWGRVHPGLGGAVRLEVLEDEFRTARQKSRETFREWCSQHLNIEIGLALHANRWRGADHWEAAAEPMTLEEFLERVDCVTAGGDGGGLDDLLGLTLIGREKVTKRWLSWSRAWVHRQALGLRPQIAPKLEELEQTGDLVIVDRLGQDVEEFADVIEQVHLAGLLPEKSGIGLDPAGVAAIVEELTRREIPTECIVGVPQGWRLNGAVKGSARKLADGSLVPARQPLMAWCVGNAAVTLKGNNELVSKEVSGASKIDPLMALFNAFDLMARNPEPAGGGPSIYETRAPLEIGGGAPEPIGLAIA